MEARMNGAPPNKLLGDTVNKLRLLGSGGDGRRFQEYAAIFRAFWVAARGEGDSNAQGTSFLDDVVRHARGTDPALDGGELERDIRKAILEGGPEGLLGD